MHWEKTITIHLTLRSLVGAILTASTVVNLVIVGAAYGANVLPTTPTITATRTTAVPTTAVVTPASTVNTILTSTLAQAPGSTPTNTPGMTPTDAYTPTQTSTDMPIPYLCVKRFYWPIYRVQPGDWLIKLAAATGTSVRELMLANCLTNSRIYTGQLLYVPRLSVTPTLSETLTASLTPTPTATATATPTNTPTATATPSQTATYTPTNTSTATSTYTPSPTSTTPPTGFCDHALFVGDVTIPDGTLLLPGEKFTKTWRFRNIGFCTWTTSYAMVYLDGEKFSAPDSTLLPHSVAPGQTVDISVDMIAPFNPGTYRGYWMFKKASGSLFGIGIQANNNWHVEIFVSDTPTVFGNPTGYPACDGRSTLYFSVMPSDPQGIRSVSVFYTEIKSSFVEATMNPDGATYFGAGASITEPISYFFRAVDVLGNVTDSSTYTLSVICPATQTATSTPEIVLLKENTSRFVSK